MTRMIIKIYCVGMSALCQLTGAHPRFGRSVSHSHHRASGRFAPNTQRKRYDVPSLGRTVTLALSARAISTTDRIGIDAAVDRIRARGVAI